MVEVKEMPASEKYTNVLESIKHEEFIKAFIEKHLGQPAADEYQKICQTGIKPITEEDSYEAKYEMAYGNWMWISSSAFRFIRERMGEDGIRQFIRADVEHLKQKNASLVLSMLSLIRVISPGSAFAMTAKQSVYKLQWLSPYSVPELTREKAVFSIPKCKLLDFPDSEDMCVIGCQEVYPAWMAEQLKVKMEPNRQGNSCTITLTPLK